MSAPNQRPTLTGQRIKTRKRDEREKYDPTAFRDAILQGFKEAEGNLEQVSSFLDKAGSKLDYRRYSETLCDILFAGGILAPGGSIQQEPGVEYFKTDTCVFGTEKDKVPEFFEVFRKLIIRYQYVGKTFESELKKLIVFLKGFTPEEREKLAITIGISLATGLGNPSCLQALFEEHLVKDGLSIEFATNLFSVWLREKDMASIHSALKKAGLETELMKLLPIHKRNMEVFEDHFKAAGLNQICDYQRSKAVKSLKKELQTKLQEMIDEEVPVKEIVATMRDEIKRHNLDHHEVVVLVWNTVMGDMERSKKDDLVTEQALKHLRPYAPLFQLLATTGKAQLNLIVKMQEYCYENTVLMNAFQKIVMYFYKVDILSEEVILKWYKDAHSPKGKVVFLKQMNQFVEWLQNAEEESDEEDD